MFSMTKEKFSEIEKLNKQIQTAAVALFKKCLELNDETGGFHAWTSFSGHVSFIDFQARTKKLNLFFNCIRIKAYSFYPDEQITELNESLIALKICKVQLIQMHKRWQSEMPDELDDFDYYADPAESEYLAGQIKTELDYLDSLDNKKGENS